MMAGGNAFSDHLNKFNRIMNIGERMSKWFTKEFGSTLCREITQCETVAFSHSRTFALSQSRIVAKSHCPPVRTEPSRPGNEFSNFQIAF